ncbi:hypothetical protein V2H45_25300 [Tumidithrix elongata RA019]|uniref:Uncharacterized protein n=1 Tax=Tumidithrix elongata BACA0141 TaxID=2716417 RepID=A0AAW9Q7W8_9CYAN|nr:hypothetical protein [Tumidithrix elongata RA019]
MRVKIVEQVIYINKDDVPQYKKGGSVVRNSYFWALRSIACQARRDRDWEYESEVWFALERMLISFAESGYLSTSETILEFPTDAEIPPVLRNISTWQEI